jgi:MFS family permease
MNQPRATTDDTPPSANFRGRLVLIGIGITLFAIGQSLVFVIVSPMARTTGLSELQFGLVLTLASLPLVASAPFWGRKSDVIGRKPIFVIGLLGSAIGTALVALVLQARLAGWLSIGGLIVALLAARAFYSLTGSALYPSASGSIMTSRTCAAAGEGGNSRRIEQFRGDPWTADGGCARLQAR